MKKKYTVWLDKQWCLHVFSGFCETKTEKRRLSLRKKNNKRKKERKLYNIVEQNKSWSINQLKSWELDMLWWTVIALWFNLLVLKCTVLKTIFSRQIAIPFVYDGRIFVAAKRERFVFSICSENIWKRTFYSFTTSIHVRRNIFLPGGAARQCAHILVAATTQGGTATGAQWRRVHFKRCTSVWSSLFCMRFTHFSFAFTVGYFTFHFTLCSFQQPPCDHHHGSKRCQILQLEIPVHVELCVQDAPLYAHF